MKQVLVGLLFMGAGVGLIYYSSQLVRIFGRIRWAEEYFGGTREAFVLFGFVLIVISFLVMSGVLGSYSVGE